MRNEVEPFTSHFSARPVRYAIVAARESYGREQHEAVIEFCCEMWGGRYTPVVLTDGCVLAEEDDAYLRRFDADVIVLAGDIDSVLASHIERKFSPITIVRWNPEESIYRAMLRDANSQLVLPSTIDFDRDWTPRLTTLRPNENFPDLALFDLSDADSSVGLFVRANFGVLRNTISEILRRNGVFVKAVGSGGPDGLASFLRGPTARASSLVYPQELAATEASVPLVRWNWERDTFKLIVGESIDDLVSAWNEPLHLHHSYRPHPAGILLPPDLTRHPELMAALSEWLLSRLHHRYAENVRLDIVSASLPVEDLEQVRRSLVPTDGAEWLQVRARPIERPPTFDLLEDSGFDLPPADVPIVSVQDSFRVLLPEPADPFAKEAVRCWMVDARIEYKASRAGYVSNSPPVWRLPRKNRIARAFFRRQGRVLVTHLPSVTVMRTDRACDVRIPSDLGFFYEALTPPDRSRTVDVSHPGRVLRSIVELFGGIRNACETFEDVKWRSIFRRLAGHKRPSTENQGDYRRRKAIDEIKKHKTQFKEAESVADTLIRLFDRPEPLEVSLPAEAILKDAVSPLSDEDAAVARAEDDFDSLVERDVLRMGLSLACPRCALRVWYPLAEARQFLECRGCGASFTPRAGTTITYALNTLVQSGIKRLGLLPVILTLAHFESESRELFMFAPSLDVFAGGSAEPLTDLDVVCVADGRLIVGEAKESPTLFDRAQLRALHSVLVDVRPDLVVYSAFAASEDPPPAPVVAAIEALASEEIDALWLPLVLEESR